jgi:hypothetical protein
MRKLLMAVIGAVAIAGNSNVIAAIADRASAIKLATDLVSREMQVASSTVELVSATAAEWRDSSLGCAKPGERYQAVMSQGWVVTLAVGGDRAVVHVGEQRAIICSHTRSGRVSAAPLAVATVKMTGLARADLAKRLKVDDLQIEIVGAKPATWPNAGLGCPDPGRTYRDEVIAGLVIELTHRDKTYRYHSDMSSQIVYCPDKAK